MAMRIFLNILPVELNFVDCLPAFWYKLSLKKRLRYAIGIFSYIAVAQYLRRRVLFGGVFFKNCSIYFLKNRFEFSRQPKHKGEEEWHRQLRRLPRASI
jgi:hypothetical protein